MYSTSESIETTKISFEKEKVKQFKQVAKIKIQTPLASLNQPKSTATATSSLFPFPPAQSIAQKDSTMNLSKTFSLLLSMAARAADAQRDMEEPTNMVEWNDAWDDLEDDGGDGFQNIVGGDFIEPGSRPWLVPVVGKYFCSGSLISPSAVMTAAHCVVEPYVVEEWYVMTVQFISQFALFVIINNNMMSCV